MYMNCRNWYCNVDSHSWRCAVLRGAARGASLAPQPTDLHRRAGATNAVTIHSFSLYQPQPHRKGRLLVLLLHFKRISLLSRPPWQHKFTTSRCPR